MKTHLFRMLATLCLLIGLLGMFPADLVRAATITVTNCNASGPGSLSAATAAVNTGDTINFGVDCPINAPISLTSTLWLPRFGVDNITISGAGHTIYIDGTNVEQIFFINYQRTVRLEYLNLVNSTNNNQYDGQGGAILDNGSNLTIDHLYFGNNKTEGNLSDHDGGAIFHQSSGSLTISNSTFENNSAQRYGGAIFTRCDTTITDSTFIDGTANYGGALAVILTSKNITFERVTMSGNSAVGPDMGSGQTPGQGGALYILDDTLNINNSTITSNGSAAHTTFGGAIYYDGGGNKFVTIKNSTIANNSITNLDPANKGGGLFINNGKLNYFNTILHNNSVSDCDTTAGLTVIDNIRNLVGVSHGCGTPYSTADPNLGPLANNGGKTFTRALLAGSPAINAGDDATCLAADQRGVPRPYGAHCDIGAFERDALRLFLPLVLR
jgi:predicted outer membrane repeat protein